MDALNQIEKLSDQDNFACKWPNVALLFRKILEFRTGSPWNIDLDKLMLKEYPKEMEKAESFLARIDPAHIQLILNFQFSSLEKIYGNDADFENFMDVLVVLAISIFRFFHDNLLDSKRNE